MRLNTVALKNTFATFLLTFAALANSQTSKEITGKAVYLMDGDTFVLQTNSACRSKKDCRNGMQVYRVRLAYIDAPEYNKKNQSKAQPYGRESTDVLSDLIENKQVHVSIVGVDRHDRVIGLVKVEGTSSVNEKMVQLGAAWMEPTYTPPLLVRRYAELERSARKARRGLWALPAQQAISPWVWRRMY